MPLAWIDVKLSKTPSFRIDGKRALITGASRGIGLAAATALAEAGAHVTLVARSIDELDSVAIALRETGAEAEILALDVTDIETAVCAIRECEPFEILVNSAGTNRPKPFSDVTQADFDVVMNLNVKAAYFITQAVAQGLTNAKKRGSIIHISSQMGHVGAANRSVYCASKWAIEGLTKAMAIELAPFGIRVNSISPTFIETPMTKPFLADPEFRNIVMSKIKLGRLGQIEDVMGAVVFLASDAAALMTGSALIVDGGWTAE